MHDTCHVCKEYTSFTHLDDTLKFEMLKNAVKGAPHLASIEANLDLYQQMGHSMMPCNCLFHWCIPQLDINEVTVVARNITDVMFHGVDNHRPNMTGGLGSCNAFGMDRR
jgi:hypothetical protein